MERRIAIWMATVIATTQALAADPPPRRDAVSMDVHALNVRIAVGICHKNGFPYYLPLGAAGGICLKLDMGVERQAIDVEAYLAQSPSEAMHGR